MPETFHLQVHSQCQQADQMSMIQDTICRLHHLDLRQPTHLAQPTTEAQLCLGQHICRLAQLSLTLPDSTILPYRLLTQVAFLQRRQQQHWVLALPPRA